MIRLAQYRDMSVEEIEVELGLQYIEVLRWYSTDYLASLCKDKPLCGKVHKDGCEFEFLYFVVSSDTGRQFSRTYNGISVKYLNLQDFLSALYKPEG